MQRETLLQLTEKRRRYLAGFDHHLLVCAGLGCPGNEEIVAELNRIVNERALADRVLVRRHLDGRIDPIFYRPVGGTI